MCNRCVVEFTHLLGGIALEGDGAAVGKGRRLVVDWFADAEGAAIVSVEESSVSGVRLIAQRLARSERSEHRVVEAF